MEDYDIIEWIAHPLFHCPSSKQMDQGQCRVENGEGPFWLTDLKLPLSGCLRCFLEPLMHDLISWASINYKSHSAGESHREEMEKATCMFYFM